MPGKNSDTRYTKEHEWVRLDGDIATVGITDHAQEALGDMVFVELPEIGPRGGRRRGLRRGGKRQGGLRRVRAAGRPDRRDQRRRSSRTRHWSNSDAEGEGWFFRIELGDPAAFEELLDEEAYNAFAGDAGVMDASGRTRRAEPATASSRAISGRPRRTSRRCCAWSARRSLDDAGRRSRSGGDPQQSGAGSAGADGRGGDDRRTARRWPARTC